MIPLIVWLYCVARRYYLAIVVILLSGLTDIADGAIARRFNMVSDFGKVFDPIADKLTQGTLILCLSTRYRGMFVLLALFALREISLLTMGYKTLKKTNSINSAKWYGKLSTFLLYVVMMLLILFPAIPLWIANTLICLCCAAVLFSLILYSQFYWSLLGK